MNEFKIIQYVHRPNNTELGKGNTHETYMLIPSNYDVTSIFPIAVDTKVVDKEKGKSYYLKSAFSREFRVNQMGEIYRDYNVSQGDEIVITSISNLGVKTNLLTVRKYNRVIIAVTDKGATLGNEERLQQFITNEKQYSIQIYESGKYKQLDIIYNGSKKKRQDSPVESDFYSVTIGGVPLPNGVYYLTLSEEKISMSTLPKCEYNEVNFNELDLFGSLYDSVAKVYSTLPKDAISKSADKNLPLQQIFYGAPGTGKSHEIKRLTKGKEVIRTTFHPDSDYSTFVGAYKPTSIEVPVRDVTGKIIIENGKQVTENRIVYEFVEQAFLQAYIKAWQAYATKIDGEQAVEQFLVIEEINRGNCAQIFGDLFQLLDRNKYGFSEYPITADKDMQKQLAKAFKGVTIADEERINTMFEENEANIVSKILNGEKILLPDNLYIWATMNTSDQSLFPIDSAFKRRWDWKYMPICEGMENGISLGWKIKANGKLYDWGRFIDEINKEIDDQTKSEDKKLGYFFCKAKDGIVSAETFVSKVIFYLWNDVFKDQAFSTDLFRDGEDELSFNSFFRMNSKGDIKEDKVELFLQNMGLEPISLIIKDDEEAAEEDDEEESDGTKRTIAHRMLLSVTFPDGTKFDVSDGLTHFAVYREAIKKIGVDLAESIARASKYHRLNHPVISKERFSDIDASGRYSYEQVGDYFLVKGMSNDTYINILYLCNEQLNLGIEVKFKQ